MSRSESKQVQRRGAGRRPRIWVPMTTTSVASRARPGTAVITKTKPQTKRPSLYRVLLLNDDYTPMEFVVHVLERFFNKDREAATRIMLHVHHHGIGECGVYHLRGGRDQGDAGHGLCPQTPASSAVRHGKEVIGDRKMRERRGHMTTLKRET